MKGFIKRDEKWISTEDIERQIKITRERRDARREREAMEIEIDDTGKIKESKEKKGVKGKADKLFRPKYAGAGIKPPVEESGGFCYGESKDISIIPTDELDDEIENYADGTKLKIRKSS